MSDRSLAAAFKTAITAALQTGTSPPVSGVDTRAEALDYDDAQDLENSNALPPIYCQISLTRRFGEEGRMSAHKTVTGWRLTTTVVGRTVDEARWCAERVATLEYARITAAGYSLSPLMFEAQNAPELDNGRYSAASSWTFTTTPA